MDSGLQGKFAFVGRAIRGTGRCIALELGRDRADAGGGCRSISRRGRANWFAVPPVGNVGTTVFPR